MQTNISLSMTDTSFWNTNKTRETKNKKKTNKQKKLIIIDIK